MTEGRETPSSVTRWAQDSQRSPASLSPGVSSARLWSLSTAFSFLLCYSVPQVQFLAVTCALSSRESEVRGSRICRTVLHPEPAAHVRLCTQRCSHMPGTSPDPNHVPGVYIYSIFKHMELHTPGQWKLLGYLRCIHRTSIVRAQYVVQILKSAPVFLVTTLLGYFCAFIWCQFDLFLCISNWNIDTWILEYLCCHSAPCNDRKVRLLQRCACNILRDCQGAYLSDHR